MNIEVNGIQITLTKEQLAHIENSKKKKSPEQLFKELVLDKIDIHKAVVDFERSPNSIFWLDGDGKYISEWDRGTKGFYFNYGNVWNVFERELNLNYYEIQEIMRVKVEEHFSLAGVTAYYAALDYMSQVERHFKNKLG